MPEPVELERGDRVLLADTRDTNLVAGITGTVVMVDAEGTVHVLWDAFYRPDATGKPELVKGLRRGAIRAKGDVLVRMAALAT